MDSLQRAYLVGNIQSADSLTLVRLLYEHALRCVRTAREMLQVRDLPGKAIAISKASESLELLISSLDLDKGGEISGNLLELYSYMQNRLLEANLQHSEAPLAEVYSLLSTLQSGWNEVGGQAPARADSRPTPVRARPSRF